MGTLKDVNRDDLLNRFASHTFTETVIEDMTKVEFKDGGSAVVAEAKTLVVDDAYKNIHAQMVGGAGIALGDYTFQGDTKFGGDSSIAPLGRISVIGTDLASGRVRTLIYSATASEGAALQAGHSRGTEATPTALNSGDRLGQFIFVGGNGTVPASNGPVMRGFTTETWSGSARGSRIDFLTILPTTTAHNLAMRVSEHGYPEVPEYTVATLPNVGNGGGLIVVTDETGGYTQAFSDGINWRRVQDRAVVA